MLIPDYEHGSIVNLMSSVLEGLGVEAELYAPLPQLEPSGLAAQKNTVLMVIDGLGYQFLTQRGAGGALFRHLEARITSVFPPTTVCAITTFMTGMAPRQHGLTGWFTYFRELGSVTAVLPFKPRFGGAPFTEAGVDAEAFFGQGSVFDRVRAHSFAVLPKRIIDSAYSRAYCASAERRAYTSLEEYFRCVREIVLNGAERNYIYAYWPGLDKLAHIYGIGSAEVAAHFSELDAAFAAFVASIQGSDTRLIVTADHGFIDVRPENHISLDDHPELENTLMLPLCGEPRTAYCYVRPEQTDRFEEYVQTKLEHCATLMRSEELIEGGYFGPGKSHPRLLERIGHYAILMHEGYAIGDRVLGEPRFVPVGVHGGLSDDEIYVPLIVVRT